MSYFNLMCLTLPGLHIQTNKGLIKTQIILKYISPILFLANINELPESVKSNVRLFADDCLLYRPVCFLADPLCLQDDLNSLQDWAQKWCMNFNPPKYTVLHIIRPPPSCKIYQHDYQLKVETVVASTQTPFLGVTISHVSDNLEWENHINRIMAKASHFIQFLYCEI